MKTQTHISGLYVEFINILQSLKAKYVNIYYIHKHKYDNIIFRETIFGFESAQSHYR